MSTAIHPRADRWLDLVNGLVAGDAREEMLDHARGCTACAELLRESAATFERTRSRAASRGGRVPAPQPVALVPAASRRRARWPAMAAAAALVVVGAGIGWRALHPPLVVVPGALPAPDASIVTRAPGGSGGAAALAEGLEAYRAGDFARARRLLERAPASGTVEDVRRLYAGSARLQTGDVRGALALLEQVDGSHVPEPWYGEWQWQLCVALASVGETARADSLRRLLAARPGPLGDRARHGWSAAPSAP